ncbi:hypothetical protein PAXINDRAFT_84506, partial [Paxillus involutus ATCC 200175]
MTSHHASKAGVSPGAPLYPWKSEPEFVTHLLFSSPHLRFSHAQKSALLEWAKALGAPDVPSMYAVKKTQERVQKLLGNPMEKISTASGNTFYLNAINKAIAMDFANPLTRFTMQDYPEDGQGRMSQVHHGNKMLEGLPDDLAPPCVHVGGSIFFVNELLQQTTRGYFIPKKFFQARLQSSKSADAEVLALGHKVSLTGEGFSVDPEMVITPASTFFHTFKDIQHESMSDHLSPTASSAAHAKLMPNPLRIKSGGRMVITVPLIVFMDDVSGNISKQWNKHHVVYMSNALMPREMLEKEFCVRFVSSSPHATPLELMQGLKESIQKAVNDPIVTFDVKYQEEVMLLPYDLFLAGDNPMQAEECSHGGLKCNYFCRTCKVGGTNAEKKTDEGYMNIFKCGELRTPEETLAQIKNQIELAKLSGGTEKVKTDVSKTGIRDAATTAIVERLLELGKSLRKREAGKPVLSEDQVRIQLESELNALLGGLSIDDHINPLLGMPGVNIHQDTPTEILHTILLGVVKYFWGQTAYILDKAHSLHTFQTHLESVDKDGLNSPTLGADYIVRYKGGLIGKHFKSLAQVMPYLIYDLVPRTVLDGWIAIGRLVVLLWHTLIEDTETYLADLSCVIGDFLSISAQCAPSILLMKAKFHFLLHLPMFIRRFGPAVLFSTERYESFNHVFRLASIYSNRQAPSRDTCQIFAEQDNVKHVVTGGVWHDPVTKKWVKAGPDVFKYITEHPQQRHLLGLPKATSLDVGNTEIVPPIEWQETQAASITDPTTQKDRRGSHFYKLKSFVAKEGDQINLKSHVIFNHGDGLRVGKVAEILMSTEQRIASHVVVSLLDFLPHPHPHLHVPCIKFPAPECKVVVTPENIICGVNVQHDCMTAGCSSIKPVFERQERLVTTRTKDLMDHTPMNAYI